MASTRHSHEWTLMYAHLDKYGRQDVHWHACFECEEMLFGPGVDCDGGLRSHRVNVDEIPVATAQPTTPSFPNRSSL